jgi:hypothetical protein
LTVALSQITEQQAMRHCSMVVSAGTTVAVRCRVPLSTPPHPEYNGDHSLAEDLAGVEIPVESAISGAIRRRAPKHSGRRTQ